jgi:Xaa-Pro aminopeptidase
MDHVTRRERLASRLPTLEVDALLITRLPNVRYLTGFTGSNGQLLLGASEALFFTDSRYEEQARRQLPDVEARIYPRELATTLPQACRDAGVARLGFESSGLTYKAFDKLRAADGAELVPVGEEVEVLRQAKEPEEIRMIERAQDLTDEAFERVLAKLVEGITEREAALELEDAMRHGGADRVGFDTIVAFGENAAEPHHGPTDRPLSRGDMVKMDFGCVVDGYHSDMTRTVALGDPDPRLVEIHEIVRRAQESPPHGQAPGRATSTRPPVNSSGPRVTASGSGTLWGTGWAWRSTRVPACAPAPTTCCPREQWSPWNRASTSRGWGVFASRTWWRSRPTAAAPSPGVHESSS